MCVELDLRGLRCPMPLLKLKQQLHIMEVGEQVNVVTTDSGSVKDFPVFLGQIDAKLLSSSDQDAEYHFLIEK